MSNSKSSRSGSSNQAPHQGNGGRRDEGIPSRPFSLPPGYYDFYGIPRPKPAEGSVQAKHPGLNQGPSIPRGILEYYGIVPRAASDSSSSPVQQKEEVAQVEPTSATEPETLSTDTATASSSAEPMAVQAKSDGSASKSKAERVHEAAAHGTSGPAGALPYLDEIQRSFGKHDVSHVKAHTDGQAAAGVRAMGAEAFTVGEHVAFAGTPSLHTAAHEAAHIVQQRAGVQLKGGVGQVGDPYECHADAVADRVVQGKSAESLLDAHVDTAGTGTRGAVQRHERKQDIPSDLKDDSARFEGDKKLEDVTAGVDKLSQGASGLTVTKLQQALVDLGYLEPTAVDGKFEDSTKTALLKFQKDKKIKESGELDAATMKELHTAYDTRKPYIDQAKDDPAKPGTHTLSADDKKAAIDAMVPAPKTGAPSIFTEDVGGQKYGDRIKSKLASVIASFHKDLYEDKAGLRADEAKNFHDWKTLEAPAQAAKDVVDKVYDSNYGGASTKPAMTHTGGNFIDQWEDEIARNASLTPEQKQGKARQKVWYLINSNCQDINTAHSAVPSAVMEKGILTPIVEDFVSDPTKVQTLLDLDIGWEGAQLDGRVYLQRYKSTDPNKNQAKEQNRVQMWKLFHTCIHEYLHTLAHPAFKTWARSFKSAGDATRYNTLVEGFCDFFTLNVRTTVEPTSVQSTVEGPYANGNPPPAVQSGVYPSNVQAEQVVSIVGIKNAQAAYFGGKTQLMGGT